jgi:hypothetical protein
MRSRLTVFVCLALLLAGTSPAAEREVVRANWNDFQMQVSGRHLEGRKIRLNLNSGMEIKTRLRSVNAAGLVVRDVRATKQWSSGSGDATVPKDQVRSVRFEGHLGHRGLLFGVIGFVGGIGIGSAIAASQDAFTISEGPAIIAIPVGITAGAVGTGLAGYYIGRATSKQAPEFVLQQ